MPVIPAPKLPGFTDTLGTIAIVLFCLWHMAAILINARPTNVEQLNILTLLARQEPYVRPYILLTSQWQHWNIFAQSTSLAMTETHIEKLSDGEWSTVRIIDRTHPGLFRHSPENVSINHLMNDGVEALKEPYLQDVCRTEHLQTGTQVRIRKRFAFFPSHAGQQSIGWWRAWQPAWSEMIVANSSCKSS